VLFRSRGSALLQQAAKRHLDKHKLCYGTDYIKPKHHWTFDVAEQWLEHLFVLDAFIIEKEHLEVRDIADRTVNTTCFERSVLAGQLNAQVKSLENLGPQEVLVGTSAPFPGFPAAQVADNFRLDGVTISVGDFVFLITTPGKVAACIKENDEYFFIVDLLGLAARISNHSGDYMFEGRRAVWSAKDARRALAWREAAPGCWTILIF
jgi:hypothetical protein